jgi:hypothetical protein
MKSIKSNNEADYLRVSDEVAEKKVQTGGFKYISKSEYKKAVGVLPRVIIVNDPGHNPDAKLKNYLDKRLKLKEKQK